MGQRDYNDVTKLNLNNGKSRKDAFINFRNESTRKTIKMQTDIRFATSNKLLIQCNSSKGQAMVSNVLPAILMNIFPSINSQHTIAIVIKDTDERFLDLRSILHE